MATPGEAIAAMGPIDSRLCRRAHRSARRWRRAFLSLVLAVPALGFVGAGDWPMIVLVITTLGIIAALVFGALTILEALFGRRE